VTGAESLKAAERGRTPDKTRTGRWVAEIGEQAAVFVVAVVNREGEACLDDFVERGALLLGFSVGFYAYFTVARSFR
jgi:hypothetical protein